jgi:hypothetical protein
MAMSYRFSFGPWNLSEGADPFGPPVRGEAQDEQLPATSATGLLECSNRSVRLH